MINSESIKKSLYYIHGSSASPKIGYNGFVIHKKGEYAYVVTNSEIIKGNQERFIFNGEDKNSTVEILSLIHGVTLIIVQDDDMIPMEYALDIKDNTSVKIFIINQFNDNYVVEEKEGIVTSKGNSINTLNKYDFWEIIMYDTKDENTLIGSYPIISKEKNELIGFLQILKEGKLSINKILPISLLKDIWLDFPEKIIKEIKPSIDKKGVFYEKSEPEISSFPKIWLPQIFNKEKLPDIITPGVSSIDFIESYSKVLTEEQVNALYEQSQKSIIAVETGDFSQYSIIGSKMEIIGSEIPEVASTASYFMGEGYRIMADETVNEDLKNSLYYNAEVAYHKAFEKDVNSSMSIRGLGAIYEKRHLYEHAYKYYKRAKELAYSSILLSVSEGSKFGSYHEILRSTRHLINIIIKIRETNKLSAWHKPHKTKELESLIEDCETLHKIYLPLFKRQTKWFQFEWFAGLIFLSKAWADIDNSYKKTQCLISALAYRREMLSSNRGLTSIEMSNLKWWISTFRFNLKNINFKLIDSVNRLEHRLNQNNIVNILTSIDEIVHLSLSPFPNTLTT